MSFDQAASIWIESLAGKEADGIVAIRRIRKNTENSYRKYIGALNLFFGTMRLCDIRLKHIHDYETLRRTGEGPFFRKRRPNTSAEPSRCPAGPKKVNQEVSVLKRILRAAKLWGDEQEAQYQPLIVEESDVQRALTKEEQALWLQMSHSRSRWLTVYWYSVLAFDTCMSTNEIRSLRVKDIQLDAGVITVPWEGSKNCYRHRTVSIGTEEDGAFRAVRWLLNRAHSMGATDLQHYLFPFRDKSGKYDPTRPMSPSGLRKHWIEVREACGLKWFRPYDTRHTAITRYAEDGTSLSEIMDMAGHISPTMTQHYTHISQGRKLKTMRRVTAQMSGQPWPAKVREVSAPVLMTPPPERAVSAIQSFSSAGFYLHSSTFSFQNSQLAAS
jgi:integrase